MRFPTTATIVTLAFLTSGSHAQEKGAAGIEVRDSTVDDDPDSSFPTGTALISDVFFTQTTINAVDPAVSTWSSPTSTTFAVGAPAFTSLLSSALVSLGVPAMTWSAAASAAAGWGDDTSSVSCTKHGEAGQHAGQPTTSLGMPAIAAATSTVTVTVTAPGAGCGSATSSVVKPPVPPPMTLSSTPTTKSVAGTGTFAPTKTYTGLTVTAAATQLAAGLGGVVFAGMAAIAVL